MENLEEEIINKLNKLLFKYNLKLINEKEINSPIKMMYYLIDEKSKIYLHGWSSIDELVLDYLYSLFYRMNQYYKEILYYPHMQLNTKRDKKLERYKRYAAAYNDIKHLENSSCLEEIIIKMDLMGI